MDRDSLLLLALSLLIVAAAVVSVSGWILFARERRAHRVVGHPHTSHSEVAEER